MAWIKCRGEKIAKNAFIDGSILHTCMVIMCPQANSESLYWILSMIINKIETRSIL